jgi:hypothetical protein
MERESCVMCGGDGLVGNAFGGSSTTCPSCNGTGRRAAVEALFHDVTKTKPSHHGPGGKAVPAPKPTWPGTLEGTKLADEVKNSGLADDVKARIIREIIEYEGSHGRCTQTFSKKVRRQLR